MLGNSIRNAKVIDRDMVWRVVADAEDAQVLRLPAVEERGHVVGILAQADLRQAKQDARKRPLVMTSPNRRR
jgi:CBS-domain-containing membrane protein